MFEALPEDGLMRRCPDIALAVDRLRWRPRVAFREGIARTIEYFTRAAVTGRVPAACRAAGGGRLRRRIGRRAIRCGLSPRRDDWSNQGDDET